jgi:hypothetical protein
MFKKPETASKKAGFFGRSLGLPGCKWKISA